MSWIATNAELECSSIEAPRMTVDFVWVSDEKNETVINRNKISGVALPPIKVEGEVVEE